MERGRAQSNTNDAILIAAARHLSERGAQLTPIRRAVLRLLCSESKAVGAYDLLFRYQQEIGKRVAPNTIYRALDFLQRYGLAAHLTKGRCYVATVSVVQHRQAAIFFTCTSCGQFTERNEVGVARAVRSIAESIGFVVANCALEIEGNCVRCAPTSLKRPSRRKASSKVPAPGA
jgi:Fur family zinc uptake transcriptional regulator